MPNQIIESATLRYFVSLQTFLQLLLLLLIRILTPVKSEAIPLTSLAFDNTCSEHALFESRTFVISLSLPLNRLNLMNDSPELLIICQRLKLQEIAIMQAIYFFRSRSLCVYQLF